MSWMRCIMRSRMHAQPQDMTYDSEPRYPTALRGNLAEARASVIVDIALEQVAADWESCPHGVNGYDPL
jgi:hypothetical protein